MFSTEDYARMHDEPVILLCVLGRQCNLPPRLAHCPVQLRVRQTTTLVPGLGPLIGCSFICAEGHRFLGFDQCHPHLPPREPVSSVGVRIPNLWWFGCVLVRQFGRGPAFSVVVQWHWAGLWGPVIGCSFFCVEGHRLLGPGCSLITVFLIFLLGLSRSGCLLAVFGAITSLLPPVWDGSISASSSIYGGMVGFAPLGASGSSRFSWARCSRSNGGGGSSLPWGRML